MDSVGSKLRVLYDFEYETRDRRTISITRGEKLFLICKTNSDWWQVIKNSSERPFFVPAPYVIEASDSNDLSNEGVYTGNLVYDTPDFKSLCDSRQTSHSTGCFNDFNRMLSEEQDVKVHGYSLPVTSKNNVQSLRVDEHEALSSCESVTGKNDLLLGYRGMADGMGSKKVNAGNAYAEMECSAHTFSRGENRTCDAKSDVLAFKVSLPFEEREKLTTDVASSDSASNVKKEIIGANVGNAKNKLSKSRSFKTKSELQKISRLNPTSSLLLSLESNDADKSKFMETFSSTNCSRNDANCDITKEKLHKFENMKDIPQIAPVALVFHNELYNLSNSQDNETNKTMDSGNISSESLFALEEDISDSGTSHKSGVVSSAQSKESIQEHSDILADDTSKEELASSGEEIWTTDYYEDVPIPQGWRMDYDEESGEQCYINEATHAKCTILVCPVIYKQGEGMRPQMEKLLYLSGKELVANSAIDELQAQPVNHKGNSADELESARRYTQEMAPSFNKQHEQMDAITKKTRALRKKLVKF